MAPEHAADSLRLAVRCVGPAFAAAVLDRG
jgi:hypothetical protein